MATEHLSDESWEQARAVLGVSDDAGEEEVRAAYLELVRRHPPDREPEAFERVRDAYEQLRDPRLRARRVLAGPNPNEPLANLFNDVKPQRRFIGLAPWIELLKEKRP